MAINDNDIRVKRTKKLIKQGLAELSKTKNLSKITVKELTDLVEINRGTFYLHYKDIADLVESIETNLYDDFNEFLNTITPKMIVKNPIDILEKYVIFVDENKEACTMLLGEHGDTEFVFKLSTVLDDKILDLANALYPNMNKSLFDLSSSFCKLGILGLFNSWFTEHPEWTPRQVAELLFQLLTNGLRGAFNNTPEGV